MSTKDTPAKFYPGGGKLYSRIAKNGKIICIFKAPPTNTQGEAMAKALDTVVLPEPRDEQYWDQTTDDYGVGFNECLKLWKESLK